MVVNHESVGYSVDNLRVGHIGFLSSAFTLISRTFKDSQVICPNDTISLPPTIKYQQRAHNAAYNRFYHRIDQKPPSLY